MSAAYSMLMCVYAKDRPDWLHFALDSVFAQTLPAAEVVIVKDGPLTDELELVLTQAAANHPTLRFIALPANRGLGEALRVGVEACQYEWIARMDADDYASPERCKLEFEALEREHADIVGCDVNEFVGTVDHVIDQRTFPTSHEALVRFAKRRTPFAHPAVIMRKSLVLKAGSYQSAYLHEDYDLFIRMLSAGGRSCSIAKPLVSVRINEDFIARRGGLKYLRALLRFNRKQLKSGWMSFADFAARSAANTVSCLMPTRLRALLYRRFLRK
ncbi:MAG: glycosyltransferase [Clostridia bacterium]